MLYLGYSKDKGPRHSHNTVLVGMGVEMYMMLTDAVIPVSSLGELRFSNDVWIASTAKVTRGFW